MSNTITEKENMKTLRTVIKTRQGLTHEWLESPIILAKGELGLEYVEKLKDGKWEATGEVKIKAGDGEHTFFPKYDITDPTKVTKEGLPYIGSDVKKTNILQNDIPLPVSDNSDDVNSVIQSMIIEEKLNEDSLQAGDIAIVKRYINTASTADNIEAHISYTSYVYDPEIVIDGNYKDKNGNPVADENKYLYKWRAMDGNYSAANVYLAQDITNTNSDPIGYFGANDSKKAGTSLQSFLSGIFQEEKEGKDSITTPSVSVEFQSGYGNQSNKEIGSSYSVPKARAKIASVGTYPWTYQTETGITFDSIKIESFAPTYDGGATYSDVKANTNNNNGGGKLDRGAATEYIAADSNFYKDEEKTEKYPVKVASKDIVYSFKATGKHTASTKNPTTNLGNEYTYTIPGATITATATATISAGFRYRFHGSVMLDSDKKVIKFSTFEKQDGQNATTAAYKLRTTNTNNKQKSNSIGSISNNKITNGVDVSGLKGYYFAVPGEKNLGDFSVKFIDGLGTEDSYGKVLDENGKVIQGVSDKMFIEHITVGGADSNNSSLGDFSTTYTILYICPTKYITDGSEKKFDDNSTRTFSNLVLCISCKQGG